MNWIKREKGFVAVVAVLVVALLAWNGMFRSSTVRAIEEARSKRAEIAVELNALNDQGVPVAEQILQAKEALGNVRRALAAEEKATGYVQAARFRPPSGVPSIVHFNDQLAGANQQLQNRTMVKGISWKVNNRTVGFPGGMLPENLAEEYLIRLALIFRVVEALADEPSGSVLAIHDILPVETTGGWGAGAPGGGVLRERGYIDRIPVRIKFEAKGPAVFRILHNLSRQDPSQDRSYLRLDSLIAERPDPNQEKLMVTMSVEAIVIRPGMPLDPEDPRGEEGGR